jgi:hypothetical protein
MVDFGVNKLHYPGIGVGEEGVVVFVLIKSVVYKRHLLFGLSSGPLEYMKITCWKVTYENQHPLHLLQQFYLYIKH